MEVAHAAPPVRRCPECVSLTHRRVLFIRTRTVLFSVSPSSPSPDRSPRPPCRRNRRVYHRPSRKTRIVGVFRSNVSDWLSVTVVKVSRTSSFRSDGPNNNNYICKRKCFQIEKRTESAKRKPCRAFVAFDPNDGPQPRRDNRFPDLLSVVLLSFRRCELFPTRLYTTADGRNTYRMFSAYKWAHYMRARKCTTPKRCRGVRGVTHCVQTNARTTISKTDRRRRQRRT